MKKSKKHLVVEITRKLLFDNSFVKKHKRKEEDFTRVRKLTFQTIFTIILRKSLKSTQLVLNEITAFLPNSIMSISNAAYSKGRKKILHTAFIELNETAIIKTIYSNKNFHKRYKGYRVLAVDGSKVRLPDTKEIRKEFGTEKFAHKSNKGKTKNAFARVSVLYDVKNKISIDSKIENIEKTSEKSLAIEHLKHIQEKDLIIFDRGYVSYELMSKIVENKGDFVIRLRSNTFKDSQILFKNAKVNDLTTTIKANNVLMRKKRKNSLNISDEIKIRFVKVVLNNGEIEVLATSLLNKDKFPRKEFKKIYWKRWGVETFYSVLKSRLGLENFTGLSPECVRQDFFSSVFLTGLESVLTEDTDKELKKKKTNHQQKVNKAVSFNIIKNKAFDILLEKKSIYKVIQELEKLFLTNPTLYRKDRATERKICTPGAVIDFLKRRKKFVF